MKIRLFLLPIIALFTLAGCGQKGPSTSSEPSQGSSSASASTAPENGPRTIEITANDQMKFSVTSIEAKPGEELHIVLTNAGTLPKEAMAHNWVLLKAGSDAGQFSAAAATAKDKDYIPDNLKDQIIAKIDLLGPRKSGEVTFKAPTQPGDYPFLCSFPAHYAVGMKGTLTVK